MPTYSRSRQVLVALVTVASAILALVACGSPGTPAPTAPAAPTNVVAAAGPGYMIVTWEHDGESVEGFEVFRSSVNGASYAAQQAEPVGVVDAEQRSFKDDNVMPGADYIYAVSAQGDGADSAPAAQAGGSTTLEPGIDLVVGTANHPLFDEVITAVGVYIYLTEAQVQAATGPLVLTGPGGWNGGNPFELTAVADLAAADGFTWFNTGIAVVSGEYQITLPTGGDTLTASATVDATSVMDQPSNVEVALSDGTATAASWTAPAGAVSHWVAVYAGDDYASATYVDEVSTRSDSVSLAHLTLQPGTYFVTVYSTTFDLTADIPEKLGQFNIALNASEMFTIEEPEQTTITWMTGGLDAEYEFASGVADDYMAANPHEIEGVIYDVTVEVVKSESSSSERFDQYLTLLEAESADVQLLEVDIGWVGDLASHLLDLSAFDSVEAVVPSHFPAIIESNTANGRLVGLPLFADVGLLYYRTDLLAEYSFTTPPATWDELEEMAATIQAGERSGGNADFWGYVWQGAAYEGLTTNALEWVYSNGGGRIVEPAGVVTIDNPNAVAALERAADWVGTISPEEVTSFQEESARSLWQQGNAAFMRNWPYAYALSSGGEAAGKFGISALPSGSGSGATKASTLGGWQMAINRYADNALVAVDLALFVASYDNQLARALIDGYLPTIPAVYTDATLLASDNAWLADFEDALENAVARPSTVTAPNYAAVSEAFYQAVHSVLTGAESASDALSGLSADLATLLGMPTGLP